MPLIKGNYIHPRLIAKKWMSNAREAHMSGQFNYAIQCAREARDIALYKMMDAIDAQMVRDCTALISLNYRTMREMGIN